MPRKKIIISVTNDLVTDQRVHRTCITLHKAGYDVTLVGRIIKDRYELNRSYKIKRFLLPVTKGPLFYALYNIRLLIYILFCKCDMLFANDLDTLLANYLGSRIKRIPLIYDTHEYFCHVPELTDRHLVRKMWAAIEKWIFPQLKNTITVNDTIAQLYSDKYGVSVQTIRNLPISISEGKKSFIPSKKDLGLPEDKIIIYQGAVNKDRGLEEAILAMHKIHGATLVIIGDGDIKPKLERLAEKEGIKEKIIFAGRVPFDQLHHYTIHADLGIALEKDTNLNYRYSLSNKLFDYIHAGIPILTSSLPETEMLFERFDLGILIKGHAIETIARKMKEMLADNEQCNAWKENAQLAAKEYCWEKESAKLLAIFDKIR